MDVISAHGVAFDDLDVAWVGVQTFVVAYLGNPLGEAAGNHRLRSGSDLLSGSCDTSVGGLGGC